MAPGGPTGSTSPTRETSCCGWATAWPATPGWIEGDRRRERPLPGCQSGLAAAVADCQNRRSCQLPSESVSMGPPRILGAAGLCCALLACADNGLTAFNADPTAEISSHGPDEAGADSTVLEGAFTRFEGRVSDPDDRAEELTTTWHLGDRQICGDAAPNAQGATFCEARVALGDDRLRLEVRDPRNSSASARVDLDVIPTDAPVALILAPTEGQRFYADQRVSFQGRATDNEDRPQDLTISWTSDLSGALDLQTDPDDSGNFADGGLLDPGSHLITLRVEDSHGKSATAVVGIAVGPPNQAPECAILRPADGSAFVLGERIRVEGLATDAELPDEDLAVSWRSDVDGILGTGTGSSTGELVFETEVLSRGEHSLSLLVADEVDARCTDAIRLRVGSPPLVTITGPADGIEVDEGDSLAFRAVAADGDDAPEQLFARWTSDLDGLLDEANPDGAGALGFDFGGLSIGQHTVAIEVVDSDGMTHQDSIRVEINGAPSAPVVSIQPDPAGSQEDLVATVDSPSVDPNGDLVAYRYAWSRDGVLQSSMTSDTVHASATLRGEVWAVTVTPNDGRVDGPSASASLTVGNGAPSVTLAVISPNSVRTDDVLTLTASGIDPDPGDSTSLSQQWRVNGLAIAQTGTTLDGASWFQRGDVVDCVVTVTDGTDSATALSNAITIDNSSPGAPTLAISPAVARSHTDDLHCQVDLAAIDPDAADSLSYSFSWMVDGLAWSGSTTQTDWPGDTIPASETSGVQTWTCTALASDGTASGPTASASVTLVRGFSGWSSTTVSLADADAFFDGEQFGDEAGTTVAAAGDVDGDGYADLLVGAYDANDGGPRVGQTYLVLGGALSGGLVVDLAQADHRFHGEADGDRAGWALSGAGDFNADGDVDLLIGAPNNDNGGNNGGAVYLFEGAERSSGGEDTLADATVIFEGPASASLGTAASWVGDLDGDGLDDLVLGAPNDAATVGRIYVWMGASLTSGSLDAADADAAYLGTSAASSTGRCISGGVDVDGDGTDDFAVGASGDDRAFSDGGAVALFSGASLPTDGSDLSAADLHITGAFSQDYLGYALALLSDIDGDGLGDLAVGAVGDDSGGSEAGKVGLFLGASLSSGATLDLGDADQRFIGEQAGDWAGAAVSAAGDVDRDGLSDLLIGAPRNDDLGTQAGKAYLILSDDRPTTRSVDLSTANFGFQGTGTQDRAGTSVSGAGDVNQDGLDDLLIGAPNHDVGGTDAGRAYLLLAP